MVHFIELTQICDGLHQPKNTKRTITILVEQICFYYDKRVVFNNREINVEESYEEITELINLAMNS